MSMYQLRRELFEKELLTRFDKRIRYSNVTFSYDNELVKVYQENGVEKVAELIREQYSSDFFDIKEFKKELERVKEKEFLDYKDFLDEFKTIQCGGGVKFEYKMKTLYVELKGQKLFSFKLYQLKKNSTDYVMLFKTGKAMGSLDKSDGNSSVITETLSFVLGQLEKIIKDKILVMMYCDRYALESEYKRALGGSYNKFENKAYIETLLLQYIGNPVIAQDDVLYLCNDGSENLNNTLELQLSELMKIRDYLDSTTLTVNGYKDKSEKIFNKKYLMSSITLESEVYEKAEAYSIEKNFGDNIRFRKLGNEDKESFNTDEFIEEMELIQKEWAEEVYLKMLVDPPTEELRTMLESAFVYDDIFLMRKTELKTIFGNLMHLLNNDSNYVLKCIDNGTIQRSGVVGRYGTKKYTYKIIDLEDGKIIIDLIGTREKNSVGRETLDEVGVHLFKNDKEIEKHIQNVYGEIVKKTPFEISIQE